MGQAVDVTTTFSDFKKTDFGIVLPYAKNIDMGMFQLAQKTAKVEVNKAIDLKIFDMPK
jgi:galactose mutarotase-like enzyme